MIDAYTFKLVEFQCSSASRKFLNVVLHQRPLTPYSRFSALQRAENSSIQRHRNRREIGETVSVLFSEPKIPQLSSR